MKAKILIIDDSVTDLTFIKGMLQDFEVLTALNGADGLEIIKNHLDLDLVILDLDMPIMNGFELLALMKDHPCYKNIRVVILTNADEIECEIKGLELGAVDYIRKPINLQSLRIRINVHLNLKASQDQILHDNEVLDETVKQKTHELIVTRDITIHALVGLLEARNIESSSHAIRTQKMMQTQTITSLVLLLLALLT